MSKCQELDCNTHSAFNLPTENKGIFCNTHKKVGMIDVIHKKCKEENCNTRPGFNLSDKKVGIYCKEHAKENMINVLDKRCVEDNCIKYPSFNSPNSNISLYCYEHKKDDIVDIKCEEENCNIQPSCNLPNEKIGIYCSTHKKENMIDVINERCLEENCDIIAKVTKYKGFCLRCFINKFPDEKISRNYKVKETHMVDFIKDQFTDQTMTFDKQTGGCSKRRPDCYIDKFTHVVITECDENQHKDYSCENKRIMELFQDFGNRPIVFIRFNPDNYINEDGKKILSSFKSFDVPMIRNPKEWSNRLKLLKETIEKHLVEIPSKEITYEYLFYDFEN